MLWVPNGHQRQVWFLWPLFLARPTADAEHAAILRHNKVRQWWRNEAHCPTYLLQTVDERNPAIIFWIFVGMIETHFCDGIHQVTRINRLSTHSKRKMIICHFVIYFIGENPRRSLSNYK